MRTSITPWTQTWNHCYLNSRKRKTKVRAEVCLVLVRLAVAPGAFLLFLYLFLSFTVFSTAIFAFVLDNHRSWSLKRVSPRSRRSFRRSFTKKREENEGGPGARFLSLPFSPPSPHCLLSPVSFPCSISSLENGNKTFATQATLQSLNRLRSGNWLTVFQN